jgi:hypothetical protein
MVSDSISYSCFDVEQRINDKFRIYRMLSIDPALKDSSSILQSFYASAQNENIGALSNVENALSAGQLNNAQTYNNNVAPINAIETNYKNYYTTYINYKNNSYTSNDSAILKTLANLPFAGEQ